MALRGGDQKVSVQVRIHFYIVFTQTCDAQRMFQKSAYKTVVNALGG